MKRLNGLKLELPRVVEATGGDGPAPASRAAYKVGIHGGCPELH